MTIMPESTNNDSQINDSIIDEAVRALDAFLPDGRKDAEATLTWWRRRPEMTDADVAAVLDRLFPDDGEGAETLDDRLASNPDFRDGYVEGFLSAITTVKAMGRDGLGAIIEVADGHVLHVCCGKIDGAAHRNFCEHYGRRSPIETLLAETAERWERERLQLIERVGRVGGCPEWCTLIHDPEDDATADLALHMGDEHVDGTVRELLDGRVEVRVARTDVLSEGTIGTPNLYVRCELELTTWEQAAELSRTILDAFGYLRDA